MIANNVLILSHEAPKYNKRHEAGIAQLSEDLRAHESWFGIDTSNGKECRVLDYASGTGLLSHVNTLPSTSMKSPLTATGSRPIRHPIHRDRYFRQHGPRIQQPSATRRFTFLENDSLPWKSDDTWRRTRRLRRTSIL